MAATTNEIRFPAHAPVGYLTKTRLIERAQGGDADAMRIVWEGNARLTYSAANRFKVPPQLVADLIQGAQFALPRAIKGFDPSRLLEFSTYAYAAIWREIHRQIGSIRFLISLPPNLYPKYIAFRVRLDRAMSSDDWFDLRDELLDAGLYESLRSIHAIVAWEPIGRKLRIPAPDSCPTDPLVAAEVLATLWSVLPDLDPRERSVLEWRYGLGDAPVCTLEEVGQFLGLTKERVRQIQLEAEANLRAALIARGIDGPPPTPLTSLTLPPSESQPETRTEPEGPNPE